MRAAEPVSGDRDRQHGAKKANFDRIASCWNGYLAARREPAAPLDATDIGHMMVVMKIARTQSGAVNVDDYVDAAGYAACAGEIAQSVAGGIKPVRRPRPRVPLTNDAGWDASYYAKAYVEGRNPPREDQIDWVADQEAGTGG